MADEIVRVLRVIEYTGPRKLVEAQVERSIHGTRLPGNGVTIRAATLGTYPEVLTIQEVVVPAEELIAGREGAHGA